MLPNLARTKKHTRLLHDGPLDRESILADQAMAQMDGDGSGEVDFAEFYDWWSKDKDSGVLTTDAEKNALFTMEIIPLEYT